MMRSTVFLVALLPLLARAQCPSLNATTSPESRDSLYAGQRAFSFDMLCAVNEAMSDPTANVFFSPYSTYSALLIAYFGAANHTEAALKQALHIPQDHSKLSTMQAYSFERFARQLAETAGPVSYELSSANRLYVASQLELTDCVTAVFDEEVRRLDFTAAPEAARNEINEWVSNETRRQINDLIPGGKISQTTQLVMVNAAYFKGLWQSRFQLENTKMAVFYISPSERTIVQMMKQKGTFNYLISETLGAHVLELPYKGDAVSLYILLPPVKLGVDSVIARLNESTFNELLNEDEATPRSVEIQIPKFSVEQTLELTPILEKLGVGDLFQPSSDLSGFTGSPGLHLDEATHKAKIEVDEQGTTAAAATALFSFRISRPLTPQKFIADHPFVYLLYDKTAKTVLFLGVFRSPPPRKM